MPTYCSLCASPSPEGREGSFSFCEQCLRHLPARMIASEDWDGLIGDQVRPGVLTDLRFIHAKCVAGLVHELVDDYNAALALLPELRQENEQLERRDAAVLACTRDLRVVAVQRHVWRRARDRGEALPEPVAPQPSALLREATPLTVPEPDSPRAALLGHFANFVSEHLPQLANYSGQTLGQTPGQASGQALNQTPDHTLDQTLEMAWNWAQSGPVAERAGRLIQVSQRPFLLSSTRPPLPGPRPPSIRRFIGHKAECRTVCLTPDGRWAVTGSKDMTLRVWDVQSGRCRHVLAGHADVVTTAAVTPDGRRIVSGSDDRTLRIWDLQSGHCERVLYGHAGLVMDLDISPNGRLLLSASKDSLWINGDGQADSSWEWDLVDETVPSHGQRSPNWFDGEPIRPWRNGFTGYPIGSS